MEFHAAKTNHSNFSESTEEKKPLTAEEKAEQMRLLEERLKQKRKEREEKEKKEELDREKSRVQIGKELAEAKRRLQEQEMKEIAEARRREKIDDRLARERVKAQIEADKLARKAKFGKPDESAQPPVTESPPKPAEPVPSPVKKDYKETKLQVTRPILISINHVHEYNLNPKQRSEACKIVSQLRLPSGKTMVQTFGVSEPLAAVRLYVELNRDDGGSGTFNLMTNFPRKVYQGDEYDMPLEALGTNIVFLNITHCMGMILAKLFVCFRPCPFRRIDDYQVCLSVELTLYFYHL